MGVRGRPTAAPAGETCLNDAAAGRFNADVNSLTSGQECSASRRLMYPGDPFNTVIKIRFFVGEDTFEREISFPYVGLCRDLMGIYTVS